MICKHCKKDVVPKEKSEYNWKCPICYTMNKYKDVASVIWKCDTGTAKRNNLKGM